MQSVKVGNSFQVTVPAAVRRQLGINPGDRLLVDVQGNHILLMLEPTNYARALEGLHAGVWAGVDPKEYIRIERD